MKKLLAITLILCLTFLFTACSFVRLDQTPAEIPQKGQETADTSSTISSSETQAKTHSQETTGEISEDEAKAIALKHAELKESDIKLYRIERDLDDYIKKYEIEFYSGKYEYEYEIAIDSGEILSSSKEIND